MEISAISQINFLGMPVDIYLSLNCKTKILVTDTIIELFHGHPLLICNKLCLICNVDEQ